MQDREMNARGDRRSEQGPVPVAPFRRKLRSAGGRQHGDAGDLVEGEGEPIAVGCSVIALKPALASG